MSTALNAQLTSEIAKKEIAEQQLLAVQADLEKGVNARRCSENCSKHCMPLRKAKNVLSWLWMPVSWRFGIGTWSAIKF